MAQERYGFFNSIAGDERNYDAAELAAALGTLASSGVAALGGCLQVTAEGSTMRTLVGFGSAMLRGYYYQLRDDGGGVQAFAHGTELELNRIDRIAVRLNLAARTIALVKLIGTAASTPVPPLLARDDETFELSLAQVRVRAGAAEILPTDITDERADDAACGLIAPESLRRSEIEQMIEDIVETAAEDTVRFTAMELSEAQQAQTRQNIGAQQKITVGGIVKTDAGGNAEKAEPGEDFAVPVTERNATLLASAWAGAEAPYTQTLAVAGITADTKGISVGLCDTATDAQYIAALAALLRPTAQGAGSVTITAVGDVPEADLPVLIRIVG